MLKANVSSSLSLVACTCLLSCLAAAPAYAAVLPQSGEASLSNSGNAIASANASSEGFAENEGANALEPESEGAGRADGSSGAEGPGIGDSAGAEGSSGIGDSAGAEGSGAGADGSSGADGTSGTEGSGAGSEPGTDGPSGTEGPAGTDGSSAGTNGSGSGEPGTDGSGSGESNPFDGPIIEITGGHRDGSNAIKGAGQSGSQTSPSGNEKPASNTSPIGRKPIEEALADSINTESYGADSLTLSGTRVNDLAEAHSNVVFDFGSTVVSASSEAIQDLGLSDSDTVSVDLTGPASAELSVNNQAVDIALQTEGNPGANQQDGTSSGASSAMNQDASSDAASGASSASAAMSSSAPAVIAATLCSIAVIVGGIVLMRWGLQKRLASSRG